MFPTTRINVAAVTVLMISTAAWGQSSSTFIADPSRQNIAPTAFGGNAFTRNRGDLSTAIASASFVAVGNPEPRQFAKHDLVTIIIRETVTLSNEAELNTEKSYETNGKISAFPHLTLKDLLNLQIQQSDLSDGQPEVNLKYDNEFDAEGEHRQTNTFTTRITARIIDIKPNGTLVLEARKQIKTDEEGFRIVLTGTCRAEDITADNTILSTQLYDLALVKQTNGELRKSTKKGVLSKVFDTIFNF